MAPSGPCGTQALGAEAESSFPGWGFAGGHQESACLKEWADHVPHTLSWGRAGAQEEGLVGWEAG